MDNFGWFGRERVKVWFDVKCTKFPGNNLHKRISLTYILQPSFIIIIFCLKSFFSHGTLPFSAFDWIIIYELLDLRTKLNKNKHFGILEFILIEIFAKNKDFYYYNWNNIFYYLLKRELGYFIVQSVNPCL